MEDVFRVQRFFGTKLSVTFGGAEFSGVQAAIGKPCVGSAVLNFIELSGNEEMAAMINGMGIGAQFPVTLRAGDDSATFVATWQNIGTFSVVLELKRTAERALRGLLRGFVRRSTGGKGPIDNVRVSEVIQEARKAGFGDTEIEQYLGVVFDAACDEGYLVDPDPRRRDGRATSPAFSVNVQNLHEWMKDLEWNS